MILDSAKRILVDLVSTSMFYHFVSVISTPRYHDIHLSTFLEIYQTNRVIAVFKHLPRVLNIHEYQEKSIRNRFAKTGKSSPALKAQVDQRKLLNR